MVAASSACTLPRLSTSCSPKSVQSFLRDRVTNIQKYSQTCRVLIMISYPIPREDDIRRHIVIV